MEKEITTIYKRLALITLTFLALSCGEKNLSKNFLLATDADNNHLPNGSEITLSVTGKENMTLDSIVYFLEDERLGAVTGNQALTTPVQVQQLGRKNIKALLYAGEDTGEITEKLTVLSTQVPKVYNYTIVNRYPHQTDAYTQGLEFENGVLYESNGEFGTSNLRKLDLETGQVLQQYTLSDAYFAEGLTILNNQIYQLTWKSGKGFIYGLDSLDRKGTFAYAKSKEGWGLCNDGKVLYKSDGTDKIWKLDPTTLKELGYIQVVDNKSIKNKFNELEYVNGKIYANSYQFDSVAIIDPVSGAVEGVIDLRSLKKEVQEGLDPQNEVLNGIAYNPETDQLFVTGKHWNTLFEITISER
ncbi:glutaminyl-peptide cyclotransferase [Croceiramulus getboli]|nr:glutaminyl-peptide cyclotransferase [Flavobacteriaceae bacterium YJPT1-3]